MIELTDEQYLELVAYIKLRFGIHLGMQKRNLVKGRMQRIFSRHGFDGFKTYFAYLTQDVTGKADDELVNAITTNHTYFMREVSHFDLFAKEVLPFLYQTVKNHDLRIWCAACSTGEEAYTLAMLIADFFSTKKENWDTKLLATDISSEVLQQAQKGIYLSADFQSLPESWRRQYFTRCDAEHYQIKGQVKAGVIFRQFNLMEEVFPFKKKFHTIFCRNVMIYFDDATIKSLIKKFYDLLEPGGYLFIGHSEVLERGTTPFRYVSPAVYRKG
ncbi:MAG: CheR family methyltransferase [Selenomonadaceae bacterium]